MAGGAAPRKAILYAFCANLGIAICKSGAAAYTGSSSMLAQAIHSFADTGNPQLLLLGLRGAKRPADAEHPLGHGTNSEVTPFGPPPANGSPREAGPLRGARRAAQPRVAPPWADARRRTAA